MIQADSLIFDLDGTLWDTCDACAVAWNVVLRQRNIPYREITGDDVRRVTGRSHEECIRATFTDLSPQQLEWLVNDTMTEDVRQIRDSGGPLFPGVAEGLKELAKSFPLAIVSNCQSGYIEMFYELSGLRHLFVDLECWGNTGLSKTENLASVIRRNGFERPIMIGDTPGDHKAAVDNRIPFMHVTYGFQRCSGSEYTADSFDQLVSLVLS